MVVALYSGNVLKLDNPVFHSVTTHGADEEKFTPVKKDDAADGGKDEKESLKEEEEVVGTLV